MDPVVSSVIDRFKQRSEVGQRKYGTTLEGNNLPFLDWVRHMQEELMDAILYLEKLKKMHGENARRKCTACNETGKDICLGDNYQRRVTGGSMERKIRPTTENIYSGK